MTPVFILSLPRSGSTLLQRVLASHSKIATASEPWLLLPLFFSLRQSGVAAIYEHRRMVEAMEDFCDQLPRKKQDYFRAVADMVSGLYEKIDPNVDFFVDKTPRYHLVLDELYETFPDARIVLLWRNPLAIAASMMNTWAAGKWNLHWFQADLFDGLAALHRFSQKAGDSIEVVRFEDFVSEPEGECRRILNYLGLPYETAMLSEFSATELNGRMGDPTGTRKYNVVSTGSLDIWKRAFSNPLRKRWAHRYLRWINESRLSDMGYSMADLVDALESVPVTASCVGSDLLRMPYGRIYTFARNIVHGGYVEGISQSSGLRSS